MKQTTTTTTTHLFEFSARELVNVLAEHMHMCSGITIDPAKTAITFGATSVTLIVKEDREEVASPRPAPAPAPSLVTCPVCSKSRTGPWCETPGCKLSPAAPAYDSRI